MLVKGAPVRKFIFKTRELYGMIIFLPFSKQDNVVVYLEDTWWLLNMDNTYYFHSILSSICSELSETLFGHFLWWRQYLCTSL